MIDFELQELREDPEWCGVLKAYLDEHAAANQRDPEFDGWTPRIKSIEGIDDERLPRLHGKLIAIGFLKFRLTGRISGMRYQLTSLGREAHSRQFDSSDGPETDRRQTSGAA